MLSCIQAELGYGLTPQIDRGRVLDRIWYLYQRNQGTLGVCCNVGVWGVLVVLIWSILGCLYSLCSYIYWGIVGNEQLIFVMLCLQRKL